MFVPLEQVHTHIFIYKSIQKHKKKYIKISLKKNFFIYLQFWTKILGGKLLGWIWVCSDVRAKSSQKAYEGMINSVLYSGLYIYFLNYLGPRLTFLRRL